MDDEIKTRNHVRRRMAQISLSLCMFIVVCFLCALFFDTMAARVEKVWPPFATFFPALMLYLAHYTHVGSQENKLAMTKENP